MNPPRETPGIAEGKYEILSVANPGGMGEVYKVRHRLLDEIRAIKVMRRAPAPSHQLQKRFLEEARLAVRLRHPNLAQLHDLAFHEDGTAYMVLEWVDGVDLAKLLADRGAPDLADALDIALQTLSAIGYLHSEGVVHRDISTDNLMVIQNAQGELHVKLVDLGIAKRVDSTDRLTATGLFVGKLLYAAPETIDSEGKPRSPDPRSDIYSFGIVLYELLTGMSPIEGRSEAEVIAGHLVKAPRAFKESDPEGRLPERLKGIVLRALEKSPANRFQSAGEMAAALSEVSQTLERVDKVKSVDLRTTIALVLSSSRSQVAPIGLEAEQEALDRAIKKDSKAWALDEPGENTEEAWFDGLRGTYQRRRSQKSGIVSSVIKVLQDHPKTAWSGALAAVLLMAVAFSGVLVGGDRLDAPVEAAALEGKAREPEAGQVLGNTSAASEAVLEEASPPGSTSGVSRTPASLARVRPTIAIVSDNAQLTSGVVGLLGKDVSVVFKETMAGAMSAGGAQGPPNLVVQLSAKTQPMSLEAYDTKLPTCEASASAQVLAPHSANLLYTRTFRQTEPRCGDAMDDASAQLGAELAVELPRLLPSGS